MDSLVLTPEAVDVPPSIAPAVASPPPAGARASAGPGSWTAIACVLLLVSGGVRTWQGRRLEGTAATVKKSPFELSTLADSVGRWKTLAGSKRSLDPQVAQVSGCTDHIMKDYYDEQTGCLVTVLLGYGPGEAISGHTPDVCFPAAGYAQSADTMERTVNLEDSRKPARLRSGVFVNESVGNSSRVEAHYSLRHAGRWDADYNFKDFRTEPAAYRILVQRHVIESERRDQDDPSEDFLAAFLSEFERRLADAEAAAKSAATDKAK